MPNKGDMGNNEKFPKKEKEISVSEWTRWLLYRNRKSTAAHINNSLVVKGVEHMDEQPDRYTPYIYIYI